ncbi:MAG: alanine/glycine:cation symporter family protein [Tissierellia bacterium]|nr:alanine/glycine:cation symporter family protein [Tissierellia bacterium]
MEAFANFTSVANDILYTYILIGLLSIVGIYFTIKIKFGQVRMLGHMVGLLKEVNLRPDGSKGISSFQAFCISAASRIGTGNIAGIAAAIAAGGPGAIFWMWIIAIVGGATSFVESTLAQIYKVKDEDGTFRGGPAYYIEQVLGKRWLGVVFSIIISITFGFMFNAMQANTIGSAVNNSTGISHWIIGIVLVILTGLVIFGGVKRIAEISSKIVPVMAVIYMLVAIFVVIKNIAFVPKMFGLIFSNAFGIRPVVGGGIGAAILNGVRRGLFSNEAGMGSVPNAAATADTSHPAKQGFVQSLGVYLDTILVCSATAFIVLLAGEQVYTNPDLEGIMITQAALSAHVGAWATGFLAICILLFSYSSIIGNYYYGESNIEFMGGGKTMLNGYRILVLIMVYLGCIGDFSIVWNTGDIFMGIMAIINLVVIILIGRVAIETFYDYKKQMSEGKNPVFNPKNIKSINTELDYWK